MTIDETTSLSDRCIALTLIKNGDDFAAHTVLAGPFFEGGAGNILANVNDEAGRKQAAQDVS